jgi:glycerol-3-phosphate dehydrogenase (NAD(P)+)
MNQNRIAVIGAGSWGTALSLLLAKNGYEVDLWVYEKDLCEIIKKQRQNTVFLPDQPIPTNIHPTNSLEEALKGKKFVFLVVPTHVYRETLKRLDPFLEPDCLLINASKGIENDSLCTIHEIIEQVVTKPVTIATISGPTFALEIAKGAPSALVAACHDPAAAERISEILSNSRLKVFISTDITGVEIGGALKNVIAIATGISDGLQLGYNARAALINRGLVEISRIGTARGAKPETFSGLSGLGDLVLTCTGDLSRNRSVGLQLGQGKKLDEITRNMKMVAEGIRTVKSAQMLKNQLNIQASIIEETYKVIYQDKPCQEALEDLMKVEISTEFSGIKGLE